MSTSVVGSRFCYWKGNGGDNAGFLKTSVTMVHNGCSGRIQHETGRWTPPMSNVLGHIIEMF